MLNPQMGRNIFTEVTEESLFTLDQINEAEVFAMSKKVFISATGMFNFDPAQLMKSLGSKAEYFND
jgi:long-subunit acyl-CoA synthetase (AMP-forming)